MKDCFKTKFNEMDYVISITKILACDLQMLPTSQIYTMKLVNITFFSLTLGIILLRVNNRVLPRQRLSHSRWVWFGQRNFDHINWFSFLIKVNNQQWRDGGPLCQRGLGRTLTFIAHTIHEKYNGNNIGYMMNIMCTGVWDWISIKVDSGTCMRSLPILPTVPIYD